MHQPRMLGASADPPCKHAAGRFIVSQNQRRSPCPCHRHFLCNWCHCCSLGAPLRGEAKRRWQCNPLPGICRHQSAWRTAAASCIAAADCNPLLPSCKLCVSAILTLRRGEGKAPALGPLSSHPSCHTSSYVDQLGFAVPTSAAAAVHLYSAAHWGVCNRCIHLLLDILVRSMTPWLSVHLRQILRMLCS